MSALTPARRWLWSDVALPLVVTRAALLVVAWLSQYLPVNAAFPKAAFVARGWNLTPMRLLDVWARWDAGWYLSIVRGGYTLQGPVGSTQSNFAFFPFYPFLVRGTAALLPAGARTDTALLAIGVVLSTVMLAGGLVALRWLVTTAEGDEAVARRAVLYLLLFPTSFFFHCFYTESAFLLLSAAAFVAARRRAWWAAGVCGGLTALTRPNGVLIAAPLLLAYLGAREWKVRRVRADVLWLALIPASLLAYMAALYPVTGALLAPLKVQAAWGKVLATPWETLLEPRGTYPVTTAVERVVVIVLLVVAVRAFWLLRDRSHAAYAALFLAAPLFTGILNSQARYAAPLFPLFAALAVLGRRPRIDWTVRAVFGVGLVAAFAAWCQGYWVG